MKGGLRLGWLAWSGIGLVLALLYTPLLPPMIFSVAPDMADGEWTLRWYSEMWKNPLLTGAVITSLEAALIVAVVTPMLALGAAMAIRELKAPRLILVLMLLLFAFTLPEKYWGLQFARFS